MSAKRKPAKPTTRKRPTAVANKRVAKPPASAKAKKKQPSKAKAVKTATAPKKAAAKKAKPQPAAASGSRAKPKAAKKSSVALKKTPSKKTAAKSSVKTKKKAAKAGAKSSVGKSTVGKTESAERRTSARGQSLRRNRPSRPQLPEMPAIRPELARIQAAKLAREKAVALYEQGLQLFHAKELRKAAVLLRKVIREHSQASEIADRAQIFLRICEKAAGSKASKPRTADQHYRLGILRYNEGGLEEAIEHFGRALKLDPQSDKIHYVMATAHALRSEGEQALNHLKQAIELNEDNRVFAANDTDFEFLRDETKFQAMVSSR